MNPKQRATAERLVADQSSSNLEWSRQVVALLRELLVEPVINQQMTTELAEPVQEPVALMWQHEETGRVTFTTMADPYVGKRWHRIPLYAAAPQQPMHCPKDGGECGAGGYCRPEPVQRRPLSDEQINRLDTEAIHGGPDSQYAFRFARAVEKAHSITGEQE